MLDEKDLQAIGQMMDTKLAQQKQEITTELRTELKQSISAAEQRITQNTVALMDTQSSHRFDLLAENQQTILEKLERLDDMDIMDTRISALEAMVKKLNREMSKLKQSN